MKNNSMVKASADDNSLFSHQTKNELPKTHVSHVRNTLHLSSKIISRSISL